MHYTYYAFHNDALNSCVELHGQWFPTMSSVIRLLWMILPGHAHLQHRRVCRLTTGSSMVTHKNLATTLYLLICRTHSRGFCMSFMHVDLKASTFSPYPQIEETLMSMEHLMTSRYNTCNNWACSAVVIELSLVPKVLGSNPAFPTKHGTCLFIVVD